MAFINEYISDEDMEKYKMVDVCREFYREQRPPNDKPRRKMAWTIDKERNIYFIPMRSGRYEESHITLCALWWDGVLLSVKLAEVGGWVNHLDKMGAVEWDLIDIWKPNQSTISDDSIKSTLKEALVDYGADGVSSEMKQYDVSFKF